MLLILFDACQTCPQWRDFHNSETYAQADRVPISISGHPVLVSCFGVSGLNWIKFRFLCWWKELYISHDRGISCNCFYIYASICKFVSLVLHICMCAFLFLSVSLSCFQVLSHYLRLAVAYFLSLTAIIGVYKENPQLMLLLLKEKASVRKIGQLTRLDWLCHGFHTQWTSRSSLVSTNVCE